MTAVPVWRRAPKPVTNPSHTISPGFSARTSRIPIRLVAFIRCARQAAAASAIDPRPPGKCRYKVEGEHPSWRATSAAVNSPLDNMARAAANLILSRAGGRPPIRPRARLAANALRVRSLRSSTSNWPKDAKMWKISRPVAVVVSIFSCSDRRPIPRAWRLSTVVKSWRMDLASRSSRTTTSTSPDRMNANASASWGRSAHVPDIDSSNTRSQPAVFRLSICPSVDWRSVDTRA